VGTQPITLPVIRSHYWTERDVISRLKHENDRFLRCVSVWCRGLPLPLIFNIKNVIVVQLEISTGLFYEWFSIIHKAGDKFQQFKVPFPLIQVWVHNLVTAEKNFGWNCPGEASATRRCTSSCLPVNIHVDRDLRDRPPTVCPSAAGTIKVKWPLEMAHSPSLFSRPSLDVDNVCWSIRRFPFAARVYTRRQHPTGASGDRWP